MNNTNQFIYKNWEVCARVCDCEELVGLVTGDDGVGSLEAGLKRIPYITTFLLLSSIGGQTPWREVNLV